MTLWVFGYGSLIWKPPPHYIQRVPGYIKGAVRRFWQSSNDHRGAGTPENPGRVVTLITREFWETLDDPHPYGHDDVVWGAAYLIDPEKEKQVKADLDFREKNGYTETEVTFYPAVETGKLPFECIAYVGKPMNEAFVGPQDPETLARDILRSHGPSGPNREYLFNLYKSLQVLAPESEDLHIKDLVERVKKSI